MIDRVYKAGGTMRGGQMQLRKIVFSNPNGEPQGWAVTGTVVTTPQTIIEKKPPRTQHLKGAALTMNFWLTWRNGSWWLARWTRA